MLGDSGRKRFGFDLLLERSLEWARDMHEQFLEEAKGDSEIERILYVAVLSVSQARATEYEDILIALSEEEELRFLQNPHFRGPPILVLRQQAKIDDRRVDFLIHCYSRRMQKWRRLIVECDGHEFHERTKAQAARDKSRDRAAIIDDYDSFRFTGSEIWHDPWGCAEQIFNWAVKEFP